jgi:hypothetical protein
MRRFILFGALFILALLLVTLTFLVFSGPGYKEQVFTEKTAKYDIEVKYPVFGNDYVDRDIQKFVAENIQNIKSLPPAPANLPVKYINTLNLSYEKPYISKERISVAFYVMTYTGGAHPLTGVFTQNYDLLNKKELTLNDLCYPNDESMDELEKLVTAKLMKKLNRPDVDWLKRGIQENKFLTFAIEPDGLAFYFGQYEVAPYSEGIQKVKLTVNELKDIYREKNPRASEVLIKRQPEYHEVTYYILDEDRNKISITVTHTELNEGGLHLRSYSLLPLKYQLALVDKILSRIFKDEKKDDYHTLFIGRLWDGFGKDRTLSDRLMDKARFSSLWDQRTGQPVDGKDNLTVKNLMKEGNIYPELIELFKKHGFDLEVASVEKVLIDLNNKLPYDCVIWFKLTPTDKGDSRKTMTKTVSIYLSDDAATPTSRKKVGECAFFEDHSFKITTEDEWIKVRLSQAIKTARQKESILLRTEEMKNGALVMSGEMLKPGDENYIYALINEAASELNRNERKGFFSLEY